MGKLTRMFDREHPVVKDGCGVFGVLRKIGSPKIGNLRALEGISCISYRGSDLGAGFASFNLENREKNLPYRIKAFVRDVGISSEIEKELESEVGEVKNASVSKPLGNRPRMGLWQGFVFPRRKDAYSVLEQTVDRINSSLIDGEEIEGRIVSSGRYLNVYKEVGYPLDVARLCGLDVESEVADLWIAHTRQPTNSPGELPIWSHPFASSEWAIVHNGDISSFGANMDLLGSLGFRSHVGTDSEVVARLLDHLVRVERLTIFEAATILTNPYEKGLSEENLSLLSRFKGARLDGPFAVVAGYCDGEDAYMIALTDRSKFRPLLFGEDDDCFYVASEENQIRSIAPHSLIWTPEPGSFFVASLKKGLIECGTTKDRLLQDRIFRAIPHIESGLEPGFRVINAQENEGREINREISHALASGLDGIEFRNSSGERFLGIGISTLRDGIKGDFKIRIRGFPGNCLANLNNGATFEVFGNAADDVADTMHSGRVVIHGNARDVLGQALQGGEIFVRGCVGNRAAIQMREYRDSRPYIIIGETADDYLGEYMAGGVALILNLSNSERPVGDFVGTGMVGGSIFVRGIIPERQVGLLPQKPDVIEYIRVAEIDGLISKEAFEEIKSKPFPTEYHLKKVLPQKLFARVKALFFSSKYSKPLEVDCRALSSAEIEMLEPKLSEFFKTFSLDQALMRKVLSSAFTVVNTREEKVERPVPPQDVPIEE